jgi:hypothetical protein
VSACHAENEILLQVWIRMKLSNEVMIAEYLENPKGGGI